MAEETKQIEGEVEPEPEPESESEPEPEDLVDPMTTLKEKCGQNKECVALYEKLTTCNDRVNSKSNTTETCSEELFDYLHCVDHCLAHNLFKHLK